MHRPRPMDSLPTYCHKNPVNPPTQTHSPPQLPPKYLGQYCRSLSTYYVACFDIAPNSIDCPTLAKTPHRRSDHPLYRTSSQDCKMQRERATPPWDQLHPNDQMYGFFCGYRSNHSPTERRNSKSLSRQSMNETSCGFACCNKDRKEGQAN